VRLATDRSCCDSFTLSLWAHRSEAQTVNQHGHQCAAHTYSIVHTLVTFVCPLMLIVFMANNSRKILGPTHIIHWTKKFILGPPPSLAALGPVPLGASVPRREEESSAKVCCQLSHRLQLLLDPVASASPSASELHARARRLQWRLAVPAAPCHAPSSTVPRPGARRRGRRWPSQGQAQA
jgi:hypothetical protein